MELQSLLQRMESIPGWFSQGEARLLFHFAERAVRQEESRAIVEIGSYCGRSTVILGAAAQSASPNGIVYAVDPHEGKVSSTQGVRYECPSLESFRKHIADFGLEQVVVLVRKHSFEVIWDRPVVLLFIDGLHDYRSVANDFRQFEPWVAVGGFICFHDCPNSDFPDVEAFVRELLRGSRFRKVANSESLTIIQKQG